MDSDNQSHSDHFDASMPLPDEAKPSGAPTPKKGHKEPNPAADLIRQKVAAAYGHEPNAAEEALDVTGLKPSHKLSKHQQFIYDLTNSGKSLPEIQQAWHEYYAGLPDTEKHKVWDEFYSVHAQASRFAAGNLESQPAAEAPIEHSRPVAVPKNEGTISRTLADLRSYVLGSRSSTKRLGPKQHMQSLLFGLGVGSIVVLIFLFSFFNERFIAPFIQPSRQVTNTPIISANAVSTNPEVIIPKINVEIPVIYGLSSSEEDILQKALEGGVVQYPETAVPGQNGNTVIFGHSSNNIFNKGKYKFAFVLLSRLEKGDTFYLDKDGKRYTYEVYKKEVVKPTELSVLGEDDKPATVSLITCDPPGTSTNRLVVVGQQISPDVSLNAPKIASNPLSPQSAIIPGNAPSLWSRFISWFAH